MIITVKNLGISTCQKLPVNLVFATHVYYARKILLILGLIPYMDKNKFFIKLVLEVQTGAPNMLWLKQFANFENHSNFGEHFRALGHGFVNE